MIEEWRDVVGFEGLYQVSNLGRVKSLPRKVPFGVAYRITEETILKPHQMRHGYMSVGLKVHNKPKYMTVHRLVAMAFIPNPDKLPHINHKDEDKTNNCVDNLEWCTAKYNNNFGTKKERQVQKRSKEVVGYNKDGIEVMRFPSSMEAERNGYNRTSIWLCCNGKYKQHKGFTWKYAS